MIYCPFNVMMIAVIDSASTAEKAHMAIMCEIMRLHFAAGGGLNV